MSLLGDKMTIVGEEPQTGTILKRNSEDSIDLASDALDQLAMRAAVLAIVKAKPGANAIALRAGDAKYYAAQDEFVSGAAAKLPPDVLGALKAAKATHLVLLTKRRAPANIQLANTRTGHGILRGLGYYINRWSRMEIVGTSEKAVGFLAAYVYFDAWLIDLDSQAVLKSVPIANSKSVAHSSATSGRDPWEALDDKARIEMLGAVLTRSVEEAIPALIAVP
jgi:hypothetical protein